MKRWRDYIMTLVLAIFFALFVREFLWTAYRVPTGSMQPALKPGDFIFSSRISYGIPTILGDPHKKLNPSLPARGDLVVFTYPSSPSIIYVKRVIALPGDRVQIVNGRIQLNDVPLKYEKVEEANSDNPNTSLFDIYHEISEEDRWRVIFRKTPELKEELKDFGPLVVPPGEVFLLGDNRDASDDSRYWGTVPMHQVLGRVVLIWLSLDWQKKWGDGRYPSVRWERVFSQAD